MFPFGNLTMQIADIPSAFHFNNSTHFAFHQ